MEGRLTEGDLVTIRPGFRLPTRNRSTETAGIIIEVLERNAQNPEWDKFLVMWENQCDALSARRLKKVDKSLKMCTNSI